MNSLDRLARASLFTNSAVPQATENSLTYTHFAPLVLDPTSKVTWPRVKTQLEAVFGAVESTPKQEEVLSGWLGLSLVVRALQMVQDSSLDERAQVAFERVVLNLTEAAWKRSEAAEPIQNDQGGSEQDEEKLSTILIAANELSRAGATDQAEEPVATAENGAEVPAASPTLASEEESKHIERETSAEIKSAVDPESSAAARPSPASNTTAHSGLSIVLRSLPAAGAAGGQAEQIGTVDPQLLSLSSKPADTTPAPKEVKKRAPPSTVAPAPKKAAITVETPTRPTRPRRQASTAPNPRNSLGQFVKSSSATASGSCIAQATTIAASTQIAPPATASTTLTGRYATYNIKNNLIRKTAVALCSLSNSTGTVPQIASAIRVKFGEDNLPTQLDKRVRETLGANASFTLTAGMSSWKLPEEWREHALSGFSSRYGMVEEDRLYCRCNRPASKANMIQCHSYDACPSYKWFHVTCAQGGEEAWADSRASWFCEACSD